MCIPFWSQLQFAMTTQPDIQLLEKLARLSYTHTAYFTLIF